jgi:hypothetical protein
MNTNYKNIISRILFTQFILGASIIPGAIAMDDNEESRLNAPVRQKIEREPEQDCGTTCWDYTLSCLGCASSCIGCCLTWYCGGVSDTYEQTRNKQQFHYTDTYTPTSIQPTSNSDKEFYERKQKEEQQWQSYKRTGAWS